MDCAAHITHTTAFLAGPACAHTGSLMHVPGCRFFTFWGTLVLVQMVSNALFRLIGAIIRAVVAGVASAVILMVLLLIF